MKRGNNDSDSDDMNAAAGGFGRLAAGARGRDMKTLAKQFLIILRALTVSLLVALVLAGACFALVWFLEPRIGFVVAIGVMVVVLFVSSAAHLVLWTERNPESEQ